jgi:hypothetical protein
MSISNLSFSLHLSAAPHHLLSACKLSPNCHTHPSTNLLAIMCLTL